MRPITGRVRRCLFARRVYNGAPPRNDYRRSTIEGFIVPFARVAFAVRIRGAHDSRNETKRNETKRGRRERSLHVAIHTRYTHCTEREREREGEERSVGERADSSSLIARHVALLGDTFRQIHSRPASATFLRETLETRPRVTAPRERERKLEALCPPQRTGSSEKIVEIYSSQCWTLTESIAVDCFEDRADHRSPATLGPHNW